MSLSYYDESFEGSLKQHKACIAGVQGEPEQPSPLISDNFDSYADNTDLGDSDSWTTIAGFPEVWLGRVYANSSLGDLEASAIHNTSLSNDQYAEADFYTDDSNNCAIGLTLRASTFSSFYVIDVYQGKIYIQKKVGSSYTNLAFADYANGTHRVRFEAVGTTLKGYVDDLLILEVTDNEIASGKAGIYHYLGITTTFYIDNFEAGNL